MIVIYGAMRIDATCNAKFSCIKHLRWINDSRLDHYLTGVPPVYTPDKWRVLLWKHALCSISSSRICQVSLSPRWRGVGAYQSASVEARGACMQHAG